MNDNLILENLYKDICENNHVMATKEEAKYSDVSRVKNMSCKLCSHFIVTNDTVSCEIVEGKISPDGLCSYFVESKKPIKPLGIPNTPGGVPTHTGSPALQNGMIKQDIGIAEPPV